MWLTVWLLACSESDRVALETLPAETPPVATSGTLVDSGVPTEGATDSTSTPATVADVQVVDLAVTSGYLDEAFGLQRGRAAVVGDFDGDGRFDVFSGNPGDTSYVLMQRPGGGQPQFAPGAVFSTSEVMWGGIANDLDNDGDTDVVVTVGGNEFGYEGLDRVFLNDGTATFDEVLDPGMALVNQDGVERLSYSAGGFAADFDQDGVLDLFVNRGILPSGSVGNQRPDDPSGRNGWLLGQGDGTFVDVAGTIGEGTADRWSSRNSAAIDFDNDGDIDVFENNWIGPNRLWENAAADTGTLRFADVTVAMSLGGGDLRWPQTRTSQCAIAGDVNQDGWDDLVIFRRGPNEPGEPLVHAAGHMVWINLEGRGFVEVGDHTHINDDFPTERNHGDVGVMGCQLGDLNADGYPDAFMGNGSPEGGEANHLMVSTGVETVTIDGVGDVVVPIYESWSSLIDMASDHDGVRHGDVNAFYPYRTHGTAFADYDNDGLYELGVHNGGPTWAADEDMQEPNRLFDFRFGESKRWLRVRLEGDGVNVPLDPIGTRVEAVVIHADNSTHTVYGRRRSASGFGAQNDPDVFLGLGDGEVVGRLVVYWTDGTRTERTLGDSNRVVDIAY